MYTEIIQRRKFNFILDTFEELYIAWIYKSRFLI